MSDIIISTSPDPSGSGSGNITGPIPVPPQGTPNYVDADSLHLVPLSQVAPSEGDILIFNNQVYVPQAMMISLNSDVDIDQVNPNDILSYDSSISSWVNKSPSDVLNGDIQFDNIVQPQNTDLLSYNGNQWVPISKDTLLDMLPLGELEDVILTTVDDAQVLSYDDSISKWVNKSLLLTDLFDINIDPINLQDQQYLVFDSTSGSWKAEGLNLQGLELLDYTGATQDSIIKYNTQTQTYEIVTIQDFTDGLKASLNISDLGDVNLQNLVNSSVLKFETSTNSWKAEELDFTDLKSYATTNNPQDDHILVFDSSLNKWITKTLDPSHLFNYSQAALNEGKSLIYNSTSGLWEPKYLKLEDLVELGVDVATIPGGSSIVWNDASSTWEFKPLKVSDLISNATNISEDSALVFEISTGEWKPVSIDTLIGSVLHIEDLLDVEFSSSPSGGQVLAYNATTSKWSSRDLTLSNLGDVELAGLSANHFIQWDGQSWKPKSIDFTTLLDPNINTSNLVSGSSIVWNAPSSKWEVRKKSLEELIGTSGVSDSSVLVWDTSTSKWVVDTLDNILGPINNTSGLSDISTSGLTSGDVLVYNTSNSKWENKPATLSLLSDVNIQGLQDTNILTWDSTQSGWIPTDLVNKINVVISNATLGQLTDIDMTNLEDNSLLSYNETLGLWQPNYITPTHFKGVVTEPNSITEYLAWDSANQTWIINTMSVSDVLGIQNESSLVDNSIIKWDSGSSSWIVVEAYELNPDIAGEIDLGELKNVSAPNKLNNQLLAWDSALQNWVPKSATDLGLGSGSGGGPISGNDWVALFESELI